MITSLDSAAQIPIQAAEYIRRYGALVPFDICPPLLPLLIAALAFAGVPESAGYVVVMLVAYAGGCVAVYALVRRYQPVSVAAFAAILYALAPARLPSASFEDGSLLLSWSFAPVLLLALDNARRRVRPANVTAVVAIAGLMWAANPAGVGTRELVAAVELALVVGACLLQSVVPRQVVLVCFVLAAGWTLFLAPSGNAIPPELASQVPAEASHQNIIGAASLAVEMNPVLASARDVVTEPGRLEESLLWLRAMAAGFLLSDDNQKYSQALECLDQQARWCLYGLPNPIPAPAVLVSRHQWTNLPPVRGLYDIEGLSQYLAWAGRPEPAGFQLSGDGAIELTADLGPLDMFLVRRNCGPGWRAYLLGGNSKELPIECDPLGFMVVDPDGEGETRVRLEFVPSWTQRLYPASIGLRRLQGGQFPRITPGGIIEAANFQPPPFEPGVSLSIFGHNFVPGDTRVLFGESAGQVLWVGPQQINVRLPQDAGTGEIDVIVESGGRRSFPETIALREQSE
jgi:hypothetical protein